jgi:hypothetical protein
MIPDVGQWGLLQFLNCKKRVPNSHPQVADFYEPFPSRYNVAKKKLMHFQLHLESFSVVPNFSEN